MGPKPSQQQFGDLFRPRLDEQLSMMHPLVRLAALIDWTEIECTFAVSFTFCRGRPAFPPRLVGGLLEKFIAPRGFAVLFKIRLCFGCNGKGSLLHGPGIYPDGSSSGDFFSVALMRPHATYAGWGPFYFLFARRPCATIKSVEAIM